jgi:FKBP-type peptidyl-prolyl cis-trans isomerase
MNVSTKFGVLAFATSATLSFAKEVELKTDIQKASYAIGQQIGENMKNQGVEVDVNVLAESMNEVFAGKKGRLTDEEMQKAMKTLQETATANKAKVALKNKEEGEKHLAENGKKKGVVTTASGLQYEITKEGKGAIPKENSTVKVHYRGTFINGKEFDSSYKHNSPAEFPVGGVIPGWTEALKLMKVGSTWNLTVPARLAYGEHGSGPIPGNSVLKFQVELLDIVPEKAAPAAPTAEKVPAAKDKAHKK